MKLGKLFFGLVLSSLMAVGVGIGIGSGNKEIKAVKAEPDIARLYLFTNTGGWDDDNPTIKVRMWNTATSKNDYIVATKVQDQYYYADVDKNNHNGCQFQRFSTDGSTYWDGSSTYNSNFANRYCTLNGYNDNSTWSNPNDYAVDENYEIAETTPSATTKRVWADPKQDFYIDGARAALRVFKGDTYYKTYILGGSSQYSTATSDQSLLFYVDIPVDHDCQLVRMHGVFNYVLNYGINFSKIKDYNTSKTVYQWTANIDTVYSCGNEDDSTVDYAKKVLDGYSTCVNSDVNGYAAYSEINTNILSKLTAAELSELRSSTFSAGTYGLRTYGEKIDYMANGGKAPSSLTRFLILNKAFGDNTGTALIVIISSIATVAVFAGYFFYKKKKDDK